jgi:cysteine desulfurase
MTPVNLDSNATTPLDPEVLAAMAEAYRRFPGHPSSQHILGQQARHALEDAREGLAALLGCRTHGSRADQLILTGGGTEANNLALRGLGGSTGKLLISSSEHSSSSGVATALAQQGHPVRWLDVDRQGLLRLDRLREELTPDTRLTSVMLANHETGVLQPLAEVTALCAEAGVPVHSDAVQAVGRIAVDFGQLGVAAMTVSAHKFHGPPGIGLLVVRGGMRLEPLHFGGPQQWGRRPGTETVALAIGMWTALERWQREAAQREKHMRCLRDHFERSLLAAEPALCVHGGLAPRLPNTCCLSFPGVNRQALALALDVAGIACSTGSACSSGSTDPSPVLTAMRVDGTLIESALRFSLSCLNSQEEIQQAVRSILRVYGELREVSRARKHAASSRMTSPQGV